MKKSAIEEQRIDSFEEWIQYTVGATYPLETILSNLSTDEIKEEIRLYALAVAIQALNNASENCKVEKVSNGFNEFYRINKQSIISESNIPNI